MYAFSVQIILYTKYKQKFVEMLKTILLCYRSILKYSDGWSFSDFLLLKKSELDLLLTKHNYDYCNHLGHPMPNEPKFGKVPWWPQQILIKFSLFGLIIGVWKPWKFQLPNSNSFQGIQPWKNAQFWKKKTKKKKKNSKALSVRTNLFLKSPI